MTEPTHIIEPVYDFSADAGGVLLRQGTATIEASGKTYTGEASARLNLRNHPCILFNITIEGVVLSLRDVQSYSFDNVSIPGSAVETSPRIKLGQKAHTRTDLIWHPRSEPVLALGDEETSLSRVVFHIMNFKDILGTERTSEKRGGCERAINHVELSCSEWRIRMQSLYESCDQFKALKAHGGYQLTHVAEMTRQDGASFSGKDATEMLETLRFFLSFSKGCWCNPVCATGYNADDAIVWESWSSPGDIWSKPKSWFDPHHCEQLVEFSPDFCSKWQDEAWRSALRECIYWYLNANSSARGIDAGIILTQTALERLSFEYAVNDKRLVTTVGFKALRASDKFRLLFSSLNIPIDLPEACAKLAEFGQTTGQVKFEDSPHALTEIRNSLVHPEHKRRNQYGDAYYEAWNLGLWYLELCILRICGYQGTYGNRLKVRAVGKVDMVPWQCSADSRGTAERLAD